MPKQERGNIVARRKRPPIPNITSILEPIQQDLSIRFFSLRDIPMAVAWAERGNIAIHENYHSRRRQSYHVISGEKDALQNFCDKIGLPGDFITASEFFRFWHLTWFPKDDGQPPSLSPVNKSE
jgi:hypothetical protein